MMMMMPSWERHFLWPLQWMGHGYNILKIHLAVQDHQSTTLIQYVGGLTILYWSGHNSFIWSEFEFHEHLMDFNWI